MQSGTEVDFTSEDSEGFATAIISSFSESINIITRPGSWTTQEADRVIVMPANQCIVEVWIIEGDSAVYYSREQLDISERIRSAFMDSWTTIDVELTVELIADQTDDFYIEELSSGQRINVQASRLDERSYRLMVDTDAIDIRKSYKIRHSILNGTKLVYRSVLDDRQFYYTGTDLGLTYSPTASSFKLWAPTATTVHVVIYADAGSYNASGLVTEHNSGQETLLTRSATGVWSGTLAGDFSGKFYMYRVAFADGTVNYAVDPYAYAIAANGARTAIIDLSSTNPSDWNENVRPPLLEPTDAIIYELHVRDFSIDPSSRVSDHNRGKYGAFTEKGLVDEAGNKLGIDHLVELGITHVHLLPVNDFRTVNELTVDDPDSCNRKYNWGYDPQNYNVPEGSYSSDPTAPIARIIEFKEMVKCLHDNGMRVVMDVVYNHTYSMEDGPFNKIMPGYFYRTNNNGTYSNGSGVGNEIATERPMVRKYIKESVSYWAKEYNIDGFRFDLMGIMDTTTMKEITEQLKSEIDPSILVYGEPWMGGATPLPYSEQTLKGSQKHLGFSVFNDHFRSAIKGDSDGEGKGFATGHLDTLDGIVQGVQGAIYDFTAAPSETINYVTAHDNLNLWDKVLKTQGLFKELGMLELKDGELQEASVANANVGAFAVAEPDNEVVADVEAEADIEAVAEVVADPVANAVALAKPYQYINPEQVLVNETVKRTLLANGIVLTAQGIPFIHAGDELLRSKYGDHNSYRSPDAVNAINWSNKSRFTEVNEYYKGLIKLRKLHPAFRMTSSADITEHLQVLYQANGVLVFKLGEYANQDDWRNIIVIYNGTNTVQEIQLPELEFVQEGSSEARDDTDATGAWRVVVHDTAAGTATLATVTRSVAVAPISMMVLYDEGREDDVSHQLAKASE